MKPARLPTAAGRCSWILVVLCLPIASRAGAPPNTRDLPLPVATDPFVSRFAEKQEPRVFFSPGEVRIAQARIKADARAKPVLERLVTQAKEHLALPAREVDETWWEAAREMPWEQTYPQVFENTWLKPQAMAKPAGVLAIAYLVTGETKYAEKSIELLMALSGYEFRAEHYDVGMNYSVWGVDALKAYDAVGGRMTPSQRAAMDGCFTRLARAVMRNDVYWVRNNIGGGINNHLAWHKAMVGLLGLFYDRPALVGWSMEGERGVRSLLEDGLVDHGLWCESSLNYQFAAIAPMILLADAQRRLDTRPFLHAMTLANGRSLKQAYDAMFDVLAPDGMVPPIGDAYAVHQRLWANPLYEYAWRAWGDERYAWLIERNPQPSFDVLFTPTLPDSPAAPRIRTTLLPEHGYAMLRSREDGQYWNNPEAICAFLTYDRSGVHANADKLSLMLFSRNRMLLSDAEARASAAHAFSSAVQRELNRGALSQNTVMIDGRDQRYSPKMLRLMEYRDLPEEKRATAADEEGILYDGVRQMRTVAIAGEYVLDVFQVACAEPRQIDWVAHLMDATATLPTGRNAWMNGAAPLELPKEGAWRWLRSARSAPVQGELTVVAASPDAAISLRMLAPEAQRIIACGYPAGDRPESATMPMIILRARERMACFAGVWTPGGEAAPASIRALPNRGSQLAFEVEHAGRKRVHLVPRLSAPVTASRQ